MLNVLQSGRHQFRVRKEMRRLWVTWAVIVFCGLSVADNLDQDEPLHYIALQGGLNMAVDSSQHLTGARILRKANGLTVAEWRKKNSTGRDEGNITFPCGAISRAGSYIVQLQYNDDRWIDRQALRVSWPPILVQAPSELVNYRTPFQVKIQWIHLKCYPSSDANITISAHVVHCGRRDGHSSFTNNCTAPSVRASRTVANIWQTGGIGVDIRFDCQDLDHLGYYRIFVRADQEGQEEEDDIIGSSESIQVLLNEDFQMYVRAKFAMPCRRELPVFYRRPACLTGSQDRVRLYGKTYLSNISLADFTLTYIGEKVLDSNRSVAALPCQLLEDSPEFDSLCFHLVTLAPADGAVVDITQTCIPYQNTSVFQEPEWGTWSAFSACTSRNCGYKGVRFRYRYCDRPPPQYPGSFCTGQPIESESCMAPPCPQKENTDKAVELEANDDISNGNLTSECMCGCNRELEDGTSSLVVSSTLCTSGYITWLFTAPSYSHFHLNLDYLRMDCQPGDQLAIRDGISVFSPLIALLNNETLNLPMVGILTTSSPQLLIEFNVTRKDFMSLSKCVAAFVISITTVPMEEAVRAESRTKLAHHMLPPPVLTLSTLLLMLFFAVSFLVVIYSKCGFHFKHGQKSKKTIGGQRSQDSTSLWSGASEYQLVSTATSLSSIETQNMDMELEEKKGWLVAKRFANLIRLQKSLPNSPFLSTGKSRRMNRLSRSSTMSPIGFRRQQQIDRIERFGKRCHSPEDIEMSLITRKESDVTLKDEKVLNTVSSRVVTGSQSMVDTDTSSITRSTLTQSCSAIFDPEQDLEFDYYDLDVRNAGCDAPDSFLRCLADDSTYWDEAELEKSIQDTEYCESIDESTELGTSLDEDDLSCA
ncbi:hypothetical protein GHT06_017234 [Daphnia sinensis]|uniref:CUB domain-containing protein n=1 Tax=Daphnia sinensis TaxID=1820382 RepID=A0AAD5KPK4_9CRUS|nr:hypothetical protein GHT06_017234 [Daphnia sinensis]